MKYLIVGGGISGLSIANLLNEAGNDVVVFEKDSRPGGMIKCDVVNGCLFHRTGGHVFNTKNDDVLNWFWKYFDEENEFVKAVRNSSVLMENGNLIPYPIENHGYCLDKDTQISFISDLVNIAKQGRYSPKNFEEFLQNRFGRTLYELYFHPYNYKVWRKDLSDVPLSWLDGKLPMPTVEEIIYNNFNHVEERTFVHSSFFYPKKGGSQLIANRLSERITIKYNSNVLCIEKKKQAWIINGIEGDRVIFCGNIKHLPTLLKGDEGIYSFVKDIDDLESHGTTTVFCEIDKNPYSWLYLPSRKYEPHRIICTGNFSPNNNSFRKMTGSIEFTDFFSKEDILNNLKNMPLSPSYLTHHFEKYTYPIQKKGTRDLINGVKAHLEPLGMYILGRFAEWEYYNMDVAMGAAIKLSSRLHQ
ncbi:MAG: protoporphyrinogen/coproporphyrinogen oxidase [Bacteroides xylanisolvens]